MRIFVKINFLDFTILYSTNFNQLAIKVFRLRQRLLENMLETFNLLINKSNYLNLPERKPNQVCKWKFTHK